MLFSQISGLCEYSGSAFLRSWSRFINSTFCCFFIKTSSYLSWSGLGSVMGTFLRCYLLVSCGASSSLAEASCFSKIFWARRLESSYRRVVASFIIFLFNLFCKGEIKWFPEFVLLRADYGSSCIGEFDWRLSWCHSTPVKARSCSSINW